MQLFLIFYILLIFFFLLCPEDVHEWGKERVNPSDPVWKKEDFVWKNWKKWTYGEILFSPIMAMMWISFYIFVLLSTIIGTIIYVLFLSRISKMLWSSLFKLCNKPLNKKDFA